jgi:hypothetical protein
MSIFANPTIASVWIPTIVDSTIVYTSASDSVKYQILELLDESTSHRRAILFYAKLIENLSIWFDYDYFNYIPLGNQEITALAYYANNLDTQLKAKIEFNGSKVRVIS